MQTPDGAGPDPAARDPRRTAGIAAVVLGLVAIVAATLQVASVGYGASPKRHFAQRRSYDMVKREVQRVLPWTIVQGLAGTALVIWGARRLRGGSDPGA